MPKQALGPGRLAVMVAFALSCFGLLLFLWHSFGGPVPLQPKGYRVNIPFQQAGQLVPQADVRISGVPVGKVVSLRPGRDDTKAVVEIKERYAPLPSDVRAVLRQKTLLGETFIELTPGTPTARKVPEGGELATGQVQAQVELDEVLQAFTPDTRRDLRSVLRGLGSVVDGRERDLSDATGQLAPFAERATGVLGVLDQQQQAVRRLANDGRGTFDIVADNDQQIQSVVRDAGRVLNTTASAPSELRATVRALPGLIGGLRALSRAQLRLFPILGPQAERLRPIARALPGVLVAANAVAPQLRGLAAGLDTVNAAAPQGLRATEQLLQAARPALTQLDPVAGTLTPVVQYLERYKREAVSSWPSIASAAQASAVSPVTGKPLNYIRILTPVDDLTLELAGTRTPTLRANPYRAPGGLAGDPAQRASFSCANTSNATIIPPIGGVPPCSEQAPYDFAGKLTRFPELTPTPLGK